MCASKSPLVWLITGASGAFHPHRLECLCLTPPTLSAGLGRELALEALKRRDSVIATARSLDKIADLKDREAAALQLDVTASLEEVHAIAKAAAEIYGRIDVVVNNAGYVLLGTVEESTPEETLSQFHTNVFGALNVTRAFLPYMRPRRTGTIVFFGSINGWGHFALRGISDALNLELAPLGLRSICIDFGCFRTNVLEPGHHTPIISRIADYREMTQNTEDAIIELSGKQPGDPRKGVVAVLNVVRGEGAAVEKPFPMSLTLGNDCYTVVKEMSEGALTRLNEWRAMTKGTDFA
ncbi:hypothetical protein GGX14DRAFT_449061 [Mycena pura]|uniref:NAD(P)-binding protein n=1 Tax=Mycena pura TaxID=153505 RepID=A0AAD6VG75_9AGAR|nr:hypothetical protein GGX14DRAFT_449061 [Mycena pura]